MVAMKAAKEAGALLSYDPNVRLPLWPSAEACRKGIKTIWTFSDVIKVSDEEVEFLTQGRQQMKKNILSLWYDGLKLLMVTDGEKGIDTSTRYLSFVKGVVDSNDLTLNFSREILQEIRIVRIMRKRLVRKAFDMILGISMSENREDYEKFWDNFGNNIMLGCIEDGENHKRLAPLLRFFSSHADQDMISLDKYVENIKPKQKDIYYIASNILTSAQNAPFLEKLTEKECEVIFLVDPIDEVAIQNLKSYKEKNFVGISKEDLDLGDKNKEKEKQIKQEFGVTCDWIKNVWVVKLQAFKFPVV